MPTVRWSDVDRTEAAGQVPFKDMLIAVHPEHIDDWRDDPDGRFAVAVTGEENGTKLGRLVKFYPSL